jgi:hypothetical protein
MTDEQSVRLKAHRSNISRYRRLLKTSLTELERAFINKRLDEEQSALHKFAAAAAPIPLAKSRQQLPRTLSFADAPGRGG